MKLISVLRIRVYSPPEAAQRIIDAVSNVTELRYGEYDSVAWISSVGTEQFRPNSDANPTVGQPGQMAKLPSVVLEFAAPDDNETLTRIVNEAILPNHPWERPVIRVSTEDEILV